MMEQKVNLQAAIRGKNDTLKAFWEIIGGYGIRGIAFGLPVESGCLRLAQSFQRAVVPCHPGCQADGLMCGEMSREQSLFPALTLSLLLSLLLSLVSLPSLSFSFFFYLSLPLPLSSPLSSSALPLSACFLGPRRVVVTAGRSAGV